MDSVEVFAREALTSEEIEFVKDRTPDLDPTVVDPSRVYVVARLKETVVGVIGGDVDADNVHINDLVVDGAVRGQGIGAQVLARFEQEIVGRGVQRVTVRTPVRCPARDFYEGKQDFFELTPEGESVLLAKELVLE